MSRRSYFAVTVARTSKRSKVITIGFDTNFAKMCNRLKNVIICLDAKAEGPDSDDVNTLYFNRYLSRISKRESKDL